MTSTETNSLQPLNDAKPSSTKLIFIKNMQEIITTKTMYKVRNKENKKLSWNNNNKKSQEIKIDFFPTVQK